MKIYEKPMAIIEKIDCEDILVDSPIVSEDADANNALKTKAGTTAANTIIFEW